MAKYLMLALNGPTKGEGDEEVFNKWYDEKHVPDFKAIDLVKSAKRFKVLNGRIPGIENWPYLTVYEIETDDLPTLFKRLGSEIGAPHATFDTSTSASIMAVQISEDD